MDIIIVGADVIANTIVVTTNVDGVLVSVGRQDGSVFPDARVGVIATNPSASS